MSFKALHIVVAVALTGMFAFPQVNSGADDPKEPKHTVIEVMRDAMKKGQWKKLAAGDATQEEAEKLVALFEDLHLNKAPHGDAKSWEEKTHAILEAAQAAAKKEAGAGDQLKKAINCRGCHQAHKE